MAGVEGAALARARGLLARRGGRDEEREPRSPHDARRGPRGDEKAGRSIRASVTVLRPFDEVQRHAQRLTNLPYEGVTVRIEEAPVRRGTEVHVELAPERRDQGTLALIAKLLGQDTGAELAQILRRFKQRLETGEVTHSDASIHPRPHAAQPPRHDLDGAPR